MFHCSYNGKWPLAFVHAWVPCSSRCYSCCIVLLSNSLVHGQAIQQDGGVKKQGIVTKWRRVKLWCGQSYSPLGCFNALTCVEDDRRCVSLVVLCNDPARVMTLGRGVIMWVLWLWIDWRPSRAAVLKLKSRILQKSNLLLYFRTNVEFNWREEKRSKSLSCGVGADDIGLWCAIGRGI
jgi:hypothetical protein